MSDIIKQGTAKWGGFWIVTALYLLGQLGADVLAWLNEVGEERFSQGLSSWSYWVLACKLTVSAVFVIRALQNGTYQEVKKTNL
jgi:hypothetical protein